MSQITQEQADVLVEYEQLKLSVKRAEERMKELKPVLLKAVPEGSKVNAVEGFFELKKRDNWKFSAEVELQESALKEAKENAIARGEATSNPTYYVEYRENKGKVVTEE